MKLSRFLLFGLFWGAVGLSSSCELLKDGPCLEGKGRSKTEERSMANFTGVDLRISGTVHITQGPEYTVQVETYGNLLSEIETSVEGSSLVIKSANCLDYSQESTNIYVTMPSLESVELKSSGEIQVNSVPADKDLRLNLSGSGKIKYTGAAKKLLLLHSGSGNIELSGTAETLETTLSGSGKILGFGLLAETSRTTLTGSGEQQVWVTNYLEANITGSGNIYYRGTPSISIYKSGSGDLFASN